MILFLHGAATNLRYNWQGYSFFLEKNVILLSNLFIFRLSLGIKGKPKTNLSLVALEARWDDVSNLFRLSGCISIRALARE